MDSVDILLVKDIFLLHKLHLNDQSFRPKLLDQNILIFFLKCVISLSQIADNLSRVGYSNWTSLKKGR